MFTSLMILLFASGKTHPRGAFFALLEHYGVIFYKKSSSLTEFYICQGRAIIYPRCHLVSWNDPCTLRNTCIFPATDVCLTSQNTQYFKYFSLRPLRSIRQSAFPSGSHLPGLSVGAQLTLSPLQRFNQLNHFL